MAVYKVPQDVEADDKLIGPFSFRQFIYLIIVAISIAAAWLLTKIFIALAIIPLPLIVFFTALALPLRKDQPMEAYLSAVISFYFLKPRRRFWQPDGINSFITIIPPKDSERVLTKAFGKDEASKRLDYLANLVDTHGWAVRGAGSTPDTSLNKDLYYESEQLPDMMDATSDSAVAMNAQLHQEADAIRQRAINEMSDGTPAPAQPVTQPSAPPAEQPVAPAMATSPNESPVSTLPSLDEIKKREKHLEEVRRTEKNREAITVARGLAEQAEEHRSTVLPSPETPKPGAINTAPNTSVTTPNTDTISITKQQATDLLEVSKDDVSIETLSKQANRVAEKNKVLKDGDEVKISFR